MRPGSVQFSEELFDEICERISNGESLRKICADEGMPRQSSVFRWLADRPELSEQYARARQAQADYFIDEIMDLADDAKLRTDPAQVAAAKLSIDTRKWFASKVLPKVYGDKVQQELSGPNGSALTVNVVKFSNDADDTE